MDFLICVGLIPEKRYLQIKLQPLLIKMMNFVFQLQ